MGVDGNGGYVAWASKVTRTKLTLPSEAQHEFAAHGGRKSIFPWGDEFDPSLLWCSTKWFEDAKSTAPVDRTNNIYENEYGVVDMVGHASQWCVDYYSKYQENKRDRLGYELVPKNPVNIRRTSERSMKVNISVVQEDMVSLRAGVVMSSPFV
jgi:formylglycine-generating enzyme required for sulfatase activity